MENVRFALAVNEHSTLQIANVLSCWKPGLVPNTGVATSLLVVQHSTGYPNIWNLVHHPQTCRFLKFHHQCHVTLFGLIHCFLRRNTSDRCLNMSPCMPPCILPSQALSFQCSFLVLPFLSAKKCHPHYWGTRILLYRVVKIAITHGKLYVVFERTSVATAVECYLGDTMLLSQHVVVDITDTCPISYNQIE